MSVLCVLRLMSKNLAPHTTYLRNIQLRSYRNVYSHAILGLDGFIKQKEYVALQTKGFRDKFRSKMQHYVDDKDTRNMIFSEDLKNMIHLAEEDDVDLVIKMMKRFNNQYTGLRFGSYKFGPIVMRMFHVLDKPQEALECFRSPELDSFFDSINAYLVLMDLLCRNLYYKEVLDVFNTVIDKRLDGIKYPRHCTVVAFAACYKMNSADGLKYAMDIWEDLLETGQQPLRTVITYAAGLALRMELPETALEILASASNQNFNTIKNLKVVALLKLNRISDAMTILKSVLKLDNYKTFCSDVVRRVELAANKCEDKCIATELKHILKLFEEGAHISTLTLDEIICLEVNRPRYLEKPDGSRTFIHPKATKQMNMFRHRTLEDSEHC